jgi:hypothetical protein
VSSALDRNTVPVNIIVVVVVVIVSVVLVVTEFTNLPTVIYVGLLTCLNSELVFCARKWRLVIINGAGIAQSV